MKKLLGLVVWVFLTSLVFAQSPNKKQAARIKPGVSPPDTEINARMAKDLINRIPEIKNTTVSWYIIGNVHSANYTIENVKYMTLYDNSGNHVETFARQAWDDRVPATIKMEWDNSAYNTFTVTGYWEGVADTGKHYYLQMMDANDTSKNVWCDENGKFSEVPFTTR